MRDTQLVETAQELNLHVVNLLDSLSALYELTEISLRDLDETQLLRQALEALMSNQDMERCSIFLLDEANLLTVAAGLDWDELLWNITRPDETIPVQARKKTPFRLGEGILGRAAESGQIEHCRSCADDPQFKKVGVDGKPVQGSLLCVPITCEEKVLGVINVYYPEANFFTMWHERLLLLFCKMLGRLLVSHRLVHHLDMLVDLRTQELTQSNAHLRKTILHLQDAQAELRISAIAFEAEEGMFITDAAGVILRVNQAFTGITGYTAEEAVGQKPGLLNSGRHDAAFYAAMWESIHHTGSWQGDIWNRRKNGEIYPERLTITAVKGDAGEITNYVATLHDITERKQEEEKVRNLAFYDVLTKLPNRRLFNDRLVQTMVASKRSGRYAALMFLDLDNFKPLNDIYGHDLGDRLLIEAARRIGNCVRKADTVARFGGDEFVVMLGELDADKDESATQAGVIAEKIRAALSEPYSLKKQQDGQAATIVEHHCTSSIGVVLFIGHTTSPDDIVKWADMAMYQAKEGGRNRVRFFEHASGHGAP
jgi:diguanylate cyclase (GGDEF)-like protein/PAS domain S-box-containing protein